MFIYSQVYRNKKDDRTYLVLFSNNIHTVFAQAFSYQDEDRVTVKLDQVVSINTEEAKDNFDYVTDYKGYDMPKYEFTSRFLVE